MSCSTCSKGCKKSSTKCPLCNKGTHRVLTEEVYAVIKKDVREYVYASQFHLCDNEDCEVVFHSTDSEEMILTQDIQKTDLNANSRKNLDEH